ncbi:YihY family inner membrane protein [Aliihoeflea aestuarii]|jgi:membrane protein|uniref:YihY/virulence factor BrkB family protein n=1 Tax=Aliihoeflea aestuarii TaxID=453840 RepID=UPI0020936990|nr:YihY/virulence factor BrkB family protein [Aliihoeflea aestuarii]MCO6391432.1 YihY family inner membrane protein [Aliihoeflea aestuarii]
MNDTIKAPARGRDADWPSSIPRAGWTDIFWRVWANINDHRVMLIAAGVTFYLLLALFPALAAFVSIYGFVADPVTVADHISFLGGFLPSASLDIIYTQLEALAEQRPEALSFGFITGFLIALWSANNGIKSMFDAMNVANQENEKRSFVKLNLISFCFTLGAMFLAIAFIFTVGVVPAILALLRLDDFGPMLIAALRWPVMLMIIITGISLLYRFGPSREYAKWRWLSWGACFSSFVWIVMSFGFSWYLQNFADYNATYGSLGAVIGFMMWTWISTMIVIVGAEINAEMEHQTALDTTTGKTRPLGLRGATMADTLGRSAEAHMQDEHPGDAPPPKKAGVGFLAAAAVIMIAIPVLHRVR